jgi:hypothetical protein
MEEFYAFSAVSVRTVLKAVQEPFLVIVKDNGIRETTFTLL